MIGAGAAGLAASIFAAETAVKGNRPQRIALLDGVKTIGAKILISGGGRCNVTHQAILAITVSCGISSTVFGARTPLELIDQADKALYAAKEGGRNCVMTLDPITIGANPSDQFEPQVRRVTPRVSNPKASE